MSSLLKVSEHDAADPSHAAILLGETQEVAQQLLELSQLDSESEEVKVRDYHKEEEEEGKRLTRRSFHCTSCSPSFTSSSTTPPLGVLEWPIS